MSEQNRGAGNANAASTRRKAEAAGNANAASTRWEAEAAGNRANSAGNANESAHVTPTYSQKMAQSDKEAKATVAGLAITVIVWLASGIGVSHVDVLVFHTPLWVITGCFGTWICAIVVAVFLCKRVITDVDLEEEGSTDE